MMSRREPNVNTNILQLLHKLRCETELAFVIISSRDLGPVEAELRPLSSSESRTESTPVRSVPSLGSRPLIGEQPPN